MNADAWRSSPTPAAVIHEPAADTTTTAPDLSRRAPVVEEDNGAPEVPQADIRQLYDEAVRRGWQETARRTARVVSLLALDTFLGIMAVLTVVRTWELVSAEGFRPLPETKVLLAAVLCIQPLALWIFGAYGAGRDRINPTRLALGMFLAAFLGWLESGLYDRRAQGKTAYLYLAGIGSLYLFLGRVLLDRLVIAAYRRGRLQRSMLVVGAADEAAEFAVRCRPENGADVRVAGWVAPRLTDAAETAGRGADRTTNLSVSRKRAVSGPFYDGLEHLERALTETGARGVIIASSLSFRAFESIVHRCFERGAAVSVLPRTLQNLGMTHLELRETSVGVLVQLSPLRFKLPQLAVKRAMDLAFTVVLLTLGWPVFLAIAVAIKIDSPGPVFFKQIRVGVGGRPFRMYKFRTMVHGADEQKPDLHHLNESGDPRLFKIRDDPRVTRMGRLLRRTSLDELPQIFNVLWGEMSLVGPRPFFPGDLAGYEPHHFERLHVLPGITGLWQVSGRSDVLDFEEVVRLDLEYIRTWSVQQDLAILLRTLPVMVRRGGAY